MINLPELTPRQRAILRYACDPTRRHWSGNGIIEGVAITDAELSELERLGLLNAFHYNDETRLTWFATFRANAAYNNGQLKEAE